MARKSKPTMYALFAGAGGLHFGMERAGFQLAVASDVSPYAEKTHQLNRPDTPFIREDIQKLTAKQLLKAAGGVRPDLIVGGPPCQGFSTLGDKLSSDPRNVLFRAYAGLVEQLEPKFVVLENVKSMVTMYGGKFKDEVVASFERIGYTVHWKILDAAQYGVPQFRQRVIFFATRHGAEFNFPEPTHGVGLLPMATVGEAIGDLAKKGSEVPNHIALVHSEKVVARYKLIPEGGRLPPPEELPPEIRRGNFGNTYKRLHRKKPALTMVPGNNAFPVHPTLHRSLTPREAARIQTFGDDIVFAGDRRNQCILVGNAVPPLMAEAVGKSIVEHMKRPATTRPAVVAPTVAKVSKQSSSRGKEQLHGSFVDLFCGAGGFTIGFERAGWKPSLAVDFNKNVTATHAKNFPGARYVEADLADDLRRRELIKSLQETDVGVIVGGPPCQGFSVFGKRRFTHTRGYAPHLDPRNRLVFAFVDFVRSLKPRWFVMENVPGLATLDDGEFLQALLKEFRKAGYPNAEARVLNAADYGVPQLRKRLVIIGNCTGHIIPWPKRKFFADPKDWQDRHRGVGEVLTDLASKASEKRFTCHVPMKHKPLLVERYRYIPEGGRLDVDALPPRLRTGYRTDKVKNYSHVFKRLHRDRPAITMVPGHNAFPIHPWLDRALTVREAARIQTFPDSVEFMGPRQEQCIQVGNAFPPLLAELIGANIRKAEVNGWFPGRVPASAYYALVERENADDTGSEDSNLVAA